ncbi:hypothetical protein DVQ18_03455 [Yersinia enterocolitica]|nr:hypothetical protein [Yersinia enterocolitica]EKN4922089.1 hypothetical protein [Yersinia enterocolitica]EKN4933763.1 hypothetical protein [Yersinia enterocolitica]EKN5028989.1 hypothetical protein [Yersinia enterocolitica]EKN5049777.1 hypothetical protein [Yersinia enterocolitica]
MSHFTWFKEESFNLRLCNVNIGLWAEIVGLDLEGDSATITLTKRQGEKRGKVTGSQLFPKVIRVWA